jgi:hypothetical protein
MERVVRWFISFLSMTACIFLLASAGRDWDRGNHGEAVAWALIALIGLVLVFAANP